MRQESRFLSIPTEHADNKTLYDCLWITPIMNAVNDIKASISILKQTRGVV